MSPIVVPPAPLTGGEGFVLDGLDLNDSTTFALDTLSMPPPPKRMEWVSGADSDGAILARDPLHENRVIDVRLWISPQASMNAALAKIGLMVDKFEECDRNDRGLALVWTPANSTLPAVTFRCLTGEITDMPISWEGGWLSQSPTVSFRLTCLPFWEAAEALVATVTSSLPLVELELTGVGGDVPALGRLVVTDAATQLRRYVAWGLESRWYPTTSPPALIVDSTSLVTTGYAGVTGTRAGAYNGASNNVITSTLRPQLQRICGLGNLLHVGSFRPQLRFWCSATTIAVRLTYQALDAPTRALSFMVPAVAGWNHVDLGQIGVPAAVLGSQRWTGQIEAYSAAAGGETFEVDVLEIMPAEQFARARATFAYQPGVLGGYDDFNARTAGAALGGTAGLVGGTWATSGAATDFVAADAPLATDETVSRATVSDTGSGRFAILGATNYTAADVAVSAVATAQVSVNQGAVARYVDASNYLRAYITRTKAGYLVVEKRVAATTTTIAQTNTAIPLIGAQYRVRLVVFASGRGIARLETLDGGVVEYVEFTDPVLATGGALATGLVGFLDQNATATAVTRYYDNFTVATPPAEPVVCYSGQSVEFRSDTTLRKDAAGVYAGTPSEVVGGRFTIPCAGGPNRKARVAVIARRNDVITAADDQIADSTTVAVYKTERGLAVPR